MGIYSNYIRIINKEKKKLNPEVQELINQYEDYTKLEIIDNDISLDELEKQKDNWLKMSDLQKKQSDDICMKIYGKNNMQMYNDLKSDIEARDEDLYDNEEIHLPVTEQVQDNTNIKEINNIKKSIQESIELGETDTILSLCTKLNNINTNSIYENTIIENILNETKNIFKPNVTEIFDSIDNLPYFSPEEMVNMGIYESYNNFYQVPADDYIIEGEITYKKWFQEYVLNTNGIISEDRKRYTIAWINKLKTLCNELKQLDNENDIKKKKQSILELGWNPELPFNENTRRKVTENTRMKLKNRYSDLNFIDISNLELSSSINESNTPKDYDNNIIYVVLTYTGTKFGKMIKYYTKSKYTHSAISLDSFMNRLYTFNMNRNGFTIEDIKSYNQDGSVVVYALFTTKENIRKLKAKIDYYIANIKNTNYSILNLAGIMMNKSIEFTNDMICSQFVDSMLKSLNIDITHKKSGLVTPNDLYLGSKAKTFYKVYEGKIKNYDKSKIDSKIAALSNKAKILGEEAQMFNRIIPSPNVINEIKEFPVQFDDDGNLLISKMKTINFDTEYMQSHKLLKVYETNNNFEGIKYELSKLWFLNLLIEQKIYSKNKKEKSLYQSRARILNDFNTYLKIITKNEKDFNFTEYYNNTPFSDATIKIKSSTLKHGVDLIKSLTKLIK